MIAGWNHLCQMVGDALLGWSLWLPSDLTLVIVAVLSAAVFALIRLATTNQDRLRRAAADKRQLRRLIHEARRRKDRDAVARHHATMGQIGLLTLGAEMGPLLAVLGPIALLATWCALRLEFHPPREGQPIKLAVYTPVSAAGKLIHLVPEDGITADGWIKRIEAVTDDGPAYGLAAWTLQAKTSQAPHRPTVRYQGESLQHELRVGSVTYAPSVVQHDGMVVSQFQYEPVKLLGRLPGIPAIGIPPWLTAYLVLTIPLVFVLRKLFRVC